MPARRHWGLIALAGIFLTSVVGYILNGHRSSPAAGTAGLILAGRPSPPCTCATAGNPRPSVRSPSTTLPRSRKRSWCRAGWIWTGRCCGPRTCSSSLS
ncbi:hypothetical protein KNE206_31070 [Kitasatospora sp. NE20-6]